MDSNKTNLRDIKKMRLERHWSQEQLAEMSGLSIRTIQRIENGENAGLESLKSLAAVFDTNIEDSNKKVELEKIRKEEAYIQKLKGFYGLLGLAVVNLILFLVIAINDSDSEAWWVFFYMLIAWIAFLGIYSFISFDFFGEEWKNKMIKKKYANKN
ncbi:helix-turn-helix domain-containing protein [Mangrovivirga sp. M17]|uniref:Helix-turn-helix domain-containing protein n=1 Tax=Mangrovivirga halotolerans TaxID=2993936 RepID=A0ABT3RU78_9BACT|nr:helix-turn-helix domain-containing protein [Mangrovivirga halotolerans]MCX2745337.1 helix-turn-helix domain-containing protein [Mangrovivirga halotolerans]